MRRPSKLNSIALSADMFHRSPMQYETRISSKEYKELLNAAVAKGKLPEFRTWQRNRKIVITDGGFDEDC